MILDNIQAYSHIVTYCESFFNTNSLILNIQNMKYYLSFDYFNYYLELALSRVLSYFQNVTKQNQRRKLIKVSFHQKTIVFAQTIKAHPASYTTIQQQFLINNSKNCKVINNHQILKLLRLVLNVSLLFQVRIAFFCEFRLFHFCGWQRGELLAFPLCGVPEITYACGGNDAFPDEGTETQISIVFVLTRCEK